MAYSDYGAFVFKNGHRKKNLEDALAKVPDFSLDYFHGIIRDEHIEVLCYKQGLPRIFYDNEEVTDYEGDRDCYDYEEFDFEYKGYKFHFKSGYGRCEHPYVVKAVTPNGIKWKCKYDYLYGAGFEE